MDHIAEDNNDIYASISVSTHTMLLLPPPYYHCISIEYFFCHGYNHFFTNAICARGVAVHPCRTMIVGIKFSHICQSSAQEVNTCNNIKATCLKIAIL